MKESELFAAYRGLAIKPCATPGCRNKVDAQSMSLFCDACFKRLMDRLKHG